MTNKQYVAIRNLVHYLQSRRQEYGDNDDTWVNKFGRIRRLLKTGQIKHFSTRDTELQHIFSFLIKSVSAVDSTISDYYAITYSERKNALRQQDIEAGRNGYWDI